MTKEVIHKLVAVVILLVVFCIPFYWQRHQLDATGNNAYMVGAVIRSSDIPPPPPPQKNLSTSQAGAWATTVGTQLLGPQSK